MDTVIACIGSGNMGAALMRGAARVCGGGSVLFTDHTPAKAQAAAAAIGARTCADNAEAARRADYVFLAVKPQAVERALDECAPALKERAAAPPALVSMAADVSIASIAAHLAERGVAGVPLARIMPNTPAAIGKGVIGLASGPDMPPEKNAALETLLAGAGLVERVDEKQMAAVGALAGCSPAYVYLFIEALADSGVRAGLSREQSLRLAAQTVRGAAAMVSETGLHPGALKDQVTSPAGTTIEGIAALEERGFRGTVMAALDAAVRRSGGLSAK
ncbi:MAG: pyrroline-5-carboxylate reductase [Treponematales bacterium]